MSVIDDLVVKYANENSTNYQENEFLKDLLTSFANDLLSITPQCIDNNLYRTPANTIDTDRCWDDGNF